MKLKLTALCAALALAPSLAAAATPTPEELRAMGHRVREALAQQQREALPSIQGKARVPFRDQAVATITGTIGAISFEDFLDDGTPFTVVFTDVRSGGFTQEFWIFCVGNNGANGSTACQRLREGRRVSFGGVLVVVEDDDGFSTPDNIIGASRINGGR